MPDQLRPDQLVETYGHVADFLDAIDPAMAAVARKAAATAYQLIKRGVHPVHVPACAKDLALLSQVQARLEAMPLTTATGAPLTVADPLRESLTHAQALVIHWWTSQPAPEPREETPPP